MKYKLPYYLLTTNLLLSACSGGTNPGNTVSDQETTVSLQLSSAQMQISSNDGDALPVVFEGTWTAINLGDDNVYVSAVDESNNHIIPITSANLADGIFTLKTAINHTTPVGEYVTQISFVACKDSDCNNTYTDSKASIELQLTVDPVPEWQTHQANASHNGYVPIWIDTKNFKKLWEWQRSPSSEPIGGINSPVSGNGEVYLSTDVYFGDAAAIALNELTGEELWRVSFGNMPAMNPPAINKNTLFVSTSGHGDTKIWAIDRTEGKLKFQSGFSSQWGNYLAPTAHGGMIYQTGGYYGGYTYAFSIDTGEQLWSKSYGTSWGMDTPTVGDEYVYVYNGNKLSILDKNNGTKIGSISDPLGNFNYDYHGSPVIGSRNNVLAFSGGSFSGRASSNTEHYDDRVISNFDIVNNKYVWSSQYAYRTFFAISNGIIYAGKNSPVAIDAIDESTGEILWSWVPPSTEDTSFHRNVIVTKNLLFVSTNSHIYVIDLKSKELLWSYNEAGMISISNNRILFLAPGFRESDGRLIAFDLRSD